MVTLLDEDLSMQQSSIYTIGLDSGEIVDNYETWLALIQGSEGLDIENFNFK